MAVSSEKKKTTTKSKNSTVKKKNTTKSKTCASKKKKEAPKKETLKEEIVFTDYDKAFLDEVLGEKKKDKKVYLKILFIFLLCGLIYLMVPRITLVGLKEETITYNNVYIDPGYSGKWLFKDISSAISRTSNLNVSKIGKYKIHYQFKFSIFNINKYRIVNVIDDVKPEIITQEDTINICPNDPLPEIKYTAIDEYDGELTDNVIINYFDDKVTLEVSDNNLNKMTKELLIDRTDKEGPKLELKGKSTIYLSAGSSYNEPGYTAVDNCDGDLTDKVIVSGSVSSSVGNYILTYIVTDSSDNKIEVTREVIVRNYNLYNSGSINNGAVYLTFDDGPSEGVTNVILDILKEEGIKATFFVTCRGPDYLIKRMYDEGHTVALHTCSHEYSQIYSSVDNYFDDLNRISNRVTNITGVEAKIIRFPGGSSNTVSRSYSYGIMSTLTSMVLDKGYRYFDWNVDSKDAGGANYSYQVYSNVVNGLSHDRPNVVLMHDIKGQTRDALRDIITYAKSEGYLFGRLENDTYMIRHSVNN